MHQETSALGVQHRSAQRKLEILEIELERGLVDRGVGLEIGRVDNEIWGGSEVGRVEREGGLELCRLDGVVGLVGLRGWLDKVDVEMNLKNARFVVGDRVGRSFKRSG